MQNFLEVAAARKTVNADQKRDLQELIDLSIEAQTAEVDATVKKETDEATAKAQADADKAKAIRDKESAEITANVNYLDKVMSDHAAAKKKLIEDLMDLTDTETQKQVRQLHEEKRILTERMNEFKIYGAQRITALKALQDQIDALEKGEADAKKPAGKPDTFEERLDKINAQRAASGQDPIHAGSRQGRDIQRQVNQEQDQFGAQQREGAKGQGGRTKKWQRYFEREGGMSPDAKGKEGGGRTRWGAIRDQVGMIPIPQGAGAQRRRQQGVGAMTGGAVGAGMKLGGQGGGGEAAAETLSILGLNQQTGQMNNAILEKVLAELKAYKAEAVKQRNNSKKMINNMNGIIKSN